MSDEKIAELREQKCSIERISDELNISEHYVVQALRRLGLDGKRLGQSAKRPKTETARARGILAQVLETFDCVWIEAGLNGGYLVHLENTETGIVLTGTEQPSIVRAIRVARDGPSLSESTEVL